EHREGQPGRCYGVAHRTRRAHRAQRTRRRGGRAMTPFLEMGPTAKAPSDLAPFRFREIGGDYLLTNYWGDWVFVTKDELGVLARGQMDPGSALHAKLAAKNFIR